MTKCSFCPHPSVASVMVRVGELPPIIDDKNPDKSQLKVVRFCASCKAYLPRPNQ